MTQINMPNRNITLIGMPGSGKSYVGKKLAEDVITNTQNQSGIVISPGGSIIYTDYAMEHLRNISTILYLKTPLEIIKARIQETPRGIVGLKGRTLKEIYRERCALYEKYASVIVDGNQEAEKVIYDITRAQF